MNTATIRYRVADFLSRHAPFQFVEQADLLALAGSGRVRFHERDEFIFQQGEPRQPQVSVIQQGTVELHEDTTTGPRLRDRLGEGELLGIGRFVNAKHYLYTAKTSSDVLLYQFPATEFDKIVAKYQQVADYLSAYFAATPTRTEGAAGTWGVTPSDPVSLRELSVRRLAVIDRSATLRDAAIAVKRHRTDAAVVVDEQQRPIGLVTAADLVNSMADALALNSQAALFTKTGPTTARPGLDASEYALLLMRNGGRPIVLTVDGEGKSPAIGLIGANDLSLLAGVNPALLAIEARVCDNTQQLARIVQRGKALLLEALSEASRAQWCAQVAGELYGAVVSRLIELAEREALEAGLHRPALRSCWLFFGGAGRQELMTWFDVDIGLVIEDASEEAEKEAAPWFARIAKRVDAGMRESGFGFTKSAVRITDASVRLPLSAWQQRFHDWVSQPFENNIYSSRSFFDFHGFYGDLKLADALRNAVFAQTAEHPRFLVVLANSCLEQMPPLTFFEGLVVEEGGGQSDILDLRRSAVFPLIDSARAFGLARLIRQPSTFARLTGASELLPAHREAFEAAKEAYRVALHHRGHAGLSAGDDGVHIRPSSLSKYEMQILKGAFRSILELLELTSEYFKAVVGR